ncbi:unnamed protein product [Ectocarpus sp. 4 AP-2014]
MTCLSRRKPLMKRVALALGLLLPSVDQVSDAFIFHAPVPTPSPAYCCGDHAAVESVGSTSNCLLKAWSSRTCRTGRKAPAPDGQRYQGKARRGIRPALMSFEPGVEAAAASAGGGDSGQEQGFDGDMAPVDLDQAMGSFSPEWANGTARVEAKEQLIKGSVIAANQTVFPYSIDSFPPLTNSEVYYNGTSERYWWNQNADAVSVYVPVPKDFDAEKVEFVAKTRHISLKFDGEQILAGTPFYRIDGYDSLFVLDSDNDPPYVQLELFKVREYQNWEDFLLEKSDFTPGGAQ